MHPNAPQATGRDNCFDLIRLVLALFVLFGHVSLYGGYETDWLRGLTKEHLSLGGLAVLGFFGLSGYLVTGSCAELMEHPKGVRRFLGRRFWRIMPGFWVCLCVTTFVVCPLIGWLRGRPLTAADFRVQDGALDYLLHNWWLHIRQYNVVPVLNDAPYKGMNGSLWSLFPEAICYLLTLGLGSLKGFRENRWFAPAVLFFLTVLTAINFGRDNLLHGPTAIVLNRWYEPLSAYFTGMTIFCYRDRLNIATPPVAWFSCSILVFLARFGGVMLFAPILIPLALLSLGRLATIRLKQDLSYGVYIYSSLVLQIFAAIDAIRSRHWLYFVVVTAVTLALAAMSWNLVEKRCIRIGKKASI